MVNRVDLLLIPGAVRQKLMHGVDANDLFYDSRSVAIYAILGAQIASVAILFPVMGYSIHPTLAYKLPLAAVFLIIGGFLLRRVGHPQGAAVLEIVGLTYLSGSGTVLLLFPLTELSLPFADNLLARADQALGFVWGPFVQPMVQDARVVQILRHAYATFNWQALILIPVLVFSTRTSRAWIFVTASAVGAVLTMMIYPWLPAVGPAVHYQLDTKDFQNLGTFAWEFGRELQQIKERGGTELRPEMVFAMVSFPSYHAVAAVLFVWAVWPIRILRYLAVALNTCMLLATIVVGIHYLTDVIAGILVGAASIAASAWAINRSIRSNSKVVESSS